MNVEAQGHQAYLTGKPVTDNPYKWPDERFTRWIDGWTTTRRREKTTFSSPLHEKIESYFEADEPDKEHALKQIEVRIKELTNDDLGEE
jgi:ribosome modulation factor